jgi:hypothetical protein
LYSSPNVTSDKAKEDEMGGTCSTYGKEEECIKGFGGKANRKEAIKKT